MRVALGWAVLALPVVLGCSAGSEVYDSAGATVSAGRSVEPVGNALLNPNDCNCWVESTCAAINTDNPWENCYRSEALCPQGGFRCCFVGPENDPAYYYVAQYTEPDCPGPTNARTHWTYAPCPSGTEQNHISTDPNYKISCCTPNPNPCQGKSCGNPPDGCGWPTAQACGSCSGGATCDSNYNCVCPNGNGYCNGNCVNLQTDRNNCGACGNVCTEGGNPTCFGGVCHPCPQGYFVCCGGTVCATGGCPRACP